MARMRATIFFRQGDYGWTENYRLNTTSYDDSANWAKNYINVRVLALGDGATIIGYRCSDDLIYRDVQSHIFTAPKKPDWKAWNATGRYSATFSGVALLVRLISSPIGRRFTYLRGVPATNVGPDNSFFQDPNTITKWAAVINYLTAGKVVIFASLDTGGPAINISDITPKNTVTTAAAHGVTPGQRIRIAGPRRNRNPVGYWIADTAAGTTLTLHGVDLPADYVYAPFSLTLKKYVPVDGVVTDYSIEGITRRATGRPFGAPRGKRSPVRV